MPEFFVLREAHLQAFRAAGLARFRRKAATILRRRFPDECAKQDAAEFEQRIELWTRQAREVGLLTERQMIRYLASELLLSRIGMSVARFRESLARLRDGNKTPEQRSIDVIQFAAKSVQSPTPVF